MTLSKAQCGLRARRDWAPLKLLSACVINFLVLMVAASAEDDQSFCCSDLEARIAELEADAARSGTKDTVVLTISGHVHRALLLWNDTRRSDVYSTDPTNWGSYVEFAGEADIAEGVQAGFTLSVEAPLAESISLSQDVSETPASPIVGRSTVFVSSASWGRLSWGRESEAHDHITEADLSGTGLFTGPGVTDWNGSFAVITNDSTVAGFTWLDVTAASIGDGENAQAVRYETPGDEGPKLRFSWGEGNVWAGAVSYAHDAETYEIEFGAGLAFYNDEQRSPCVDAEPRANCAAAAASLSVLHKASGIGGAVAAGGIVDDPRKILPTGAGKEVWIYTKLFDKLTLVAAGETVVYGEVFRGRHAGALFIDELSDEAVPFRADVAMTGAGIMQNFENAEMQTYVGWRRYELDAGFTGSQPRDVSSRFDTWLAGMRISF